MGTKHEIHCDHLIYFVLVLSSLRRQKKKESNILILSTSKCRRKSNTCDEIHDDHFLILLFANYFGNSFRHVKRSRHPTFSGQGKIGNEAWSLVRLFKNLKSIFYFVSSRNITFKSNHFEKLRRYHEIHLISSILHFFRGKKYYTFRSTAFKLFFTTYTEVFKIKSTSNIIEHSLKYFIPRKILTIPNYFYEISYMEPIKWRKKLGRCIYIRTEKHQNWYELLISCCNVLSDFDKRLNLNSINNL